MTSRSFSFQLLYSFILYVTISLSKNMITQEEITFFLSGGVALATIPDNPAPAWLPDKSWAEICRSNVLSSFAKFQQSFLDDLHDWKKYYDLLNPEDSPLPHPWETVLTPFQKLIVTRIIRTDKVMIMVRTVRHIFFSSHMKIIADTTIRESWNGSEFYRTSTLRHLQVLRRCQLFDTIDFHSIPWFRPNGSANEIRRKYQLHRQVSVDLTGSRTGTYR